MAEPITVRLNDELAVQLRSLATFDRVTLADEIREAIGLLLEARKTDPAYLKRVKTLFEETRQALVALEGTEQIVEALGANGDDGTRLPAAEPVLEAVGAGVTVSH